MNKFLKQTMIREIVRDRENEFYWDFKATGRIRELVNNTFYLKYN